MLTMRVARYLIVISKYKYKEKKNTMCTFREKIPNYQEINIPVDVLQYLYHVFFYKKIQSKMCRNIVDMYDKDNLHVSSL